MKTYKLSDIKTQETLLAEQLMLASPIDKAKAFISMYKRIDRFYGLNNKYLSNGKLRSQ